MKIRPNAGGIVLVVVGALFLLSNLDLLPRLGPIFRTWWPAILIVLGLNMMMGRDK
jgi:LiaI-LiaF-like transmembrane region